MEREYTTGKVPDRLSEYLKENRNAGSFRRRAVLIKGSAGWELVCCVVEGFIPTEVAPQPVSSRRYPQALLYEDFLTPSECLEFAKELQDGHTSFDGISIARGNSSQWTTELVPISNDYMSRAGWVISLPYGKGNRPRMPTLLVADQPY